MVRAIDYLRDEDNDLIIKDGDFLKGDATLKHQKSLLICEKANFKQFPTIGVAMRNSINDDGNADELEGIIQNEFENDGMKISKLEAKSFSDIEIVASYE